MLSEAPSCGDLGVCRMAFVPAGMGFPTVSGHTRGRGSWQGQWSLRECFLLRWDRCDVKIPRRSYPLALSHSARFCVARQGGNWLQPQNGPAGAFQHVSAAAQTERSVWAGASVDVVICNGVLNLVPEKDRAFAEIRRVSRPGGRLQLGDIVIDTEFGDDVRRNIDLWTG